MATHPEHTPRRSRWQSEEAQLLASVHQVRSLMPKVSPCFTHACDARCHVATPPRRSRVEVVGEFLDTSSFSTCQVCLGF